MRRGALALVLVCVAIAMLAFASAAAADGGAEPGSRYLALGDSVTFGYRESSTQPPPNYRDSSTFKAYPGLVGRSMHLRIANAACPGETSSSLIDPNAPSNGCENSPGSEIGYRDAFPLHVSYKGSQLAFAVGFLKKHPGTRVVSLMIGANDLFRCQTTTPDACTSKSEQDATFNTIERNVRRILSAIRNKADYDGQIVLVHYYSLDYNSAFVNAVVRRLNDTMDAGAKGFHAAHADGYGEFRRASAHSGNSPCKAGLLTQLSNGGCGVHPSYSGQGMLALAVERVIRR